MSKIGRKVIELKGATVTIEGQVIRIKGPKGSREHQVPSLLKPVLENGVLRLELTAKSAGANMVWGLHRALVANKIIGVTKGFTKNLEINGIGFKAKEIKKSGHPSILEMEMGYSHPVIINLPEGVTVDIDKTGQRLAFHSIDKDQVGAICDTVRAVRPPEPYKKTGIKLADEIIIGKAGKAKSA